MRNRMFLAAFTVIASAAWSQVGAHPGDGFAGGHVAAPVMHGSPSGQISMSGHSAPFHSSSVAPVLSQPGRTSRASSLDTQGNWTSSGFVPSRNGYSSRNGHNRGSNYGNGMVGYLLAYPASYLGGGLNIDDNDPNDPNQQAAQAGGGYVDNAPPLQGPGEYYGPPDTARAAYNPQGYTNPVAPNAYVSKAGASASDGLGHPKVTLIFKDGRTPLQIQNYAMSQTKVFVRDNGTDRDIFISDLDVPATMAANDQAGIDFALPVAR